MLDKRWSLIMSSMLLAGIGTAGCTDDGGSVVNNGGQNNQVECKTTDDCNKAECKSDKICNNAITDPKDCTKDTCSQEICKSQDVCKGGNGQEQPCTAADCSSDRCKSDPVCKGTDQQPEKKLCPSGSGAAGADYSDPSGDADGDGISNKDELEASYDPCTKEPGTDIDRKDTLDLRKVACDMKTITVDSLSVKKFAHAKFNNVTYRESQESDNYIAFDSDSGVSGVFIYSSEELKKGNVLMKKAFNGKEYSAFVTDPVVKIKGANLSVPEHEISRVRYQIKADGTPVADILNSLAKQVLHTDLPKSSSSKTCTDQTIIYFAGVKYKGKESESFYSISAACQSDLNSNGSVNAIMDDVISGTLIAPEQTYYAANDKYGCLTKKLDKMAGFVDFIWVIDNSGSMVDELSNLSATVDKFMAKLNASGIDYRIGVTATDSYLLDEWPDYYMADVLEANGDSNGYYEPSGLINGGPMPSNNKALRCMMPASEVNEQALKNKILNRKGCSKNPPDGLPKNFSLPSPADKNICGFGFEDGFKSGLTALQRLSLSNGNSVEGLENSDVIMAAKEKFACKGNSGCPELEANCGLRKDALKYILFVSDEESRQFKENDDGNSVAKNKGTQEETNIKNLIGTFNYTLDGDNFSYAGFYVSNDEEAYDELGELEYRKTTRSLIGCRTGYQLDGSGKMLSGKWDFTGNGDFSKKCHVAGNDGNALKTSLLSESGLREDTPLEEIQSNYPEYYAMLNYYMEQYRKFAGEGGITAFALVGDSGRAISEDDPRDGSCRKLAACNSGCKILDSDGVLQPADGIKYACDDCAEWNTNDTGTMIGADHGLSYIHFAKFLDKDRGGKSASICTDQFDNTINAIFEDVQSRVSAKINLEGYPISSTIRVFMTGKNQAAVEFTRGATKNGWTYDPVENAIILTGMDSSVDTNGYVAFSFVMWQKNGV